MVDYGEHIIVIYLPTKRMIAMCAYPNVLQACSRERINLRVDCLTRIGAQSLYRESKSLLRMALIWIAGQRKFKVVLA